MDSEEREQMIVNVVLKKNNPISIVTQKSNGKSLIGLRLYSKELDIVNKLTSSVTLWDERDPRVVLRELIDALDEYYAKEKKL